jgi:hypothetical protein
MKATCVSILLICLVAATFSNGLIIACFNINQTYIAKELCVNRNNPNSNCNGHCYLCKKLDTQEKPEGTNGTTSKEKFEVQLFFVEGPGDIVLTASAKKSNYNTQQQFAEQLVVNSFFHPPSA